MQPSVLILGIGNVLWADEGFGVRCVERLAARWSFGPGVTVLDGGTQGLYLLPFMEAADRLIVFDAVDYGLVPGTMKIVEDEAVPAFMGAKKMSLHQTGFQDVIATAQLMGYCPDHLLLIGCQPEELEDYGGGLRAACPPVLAGMIEARGVGLLTLKHRSAIPIFLIVDLDQDEPDRLPEITYQNVMGVQIRCLKRCDGPHFAASVYLMAKMMKYTTDD